MSARQVMARPAERSARVLVGLLLSLSLVGLGWGAWADYQSVFNQARLQASQLSMAVETRTAEEVARAFDALDRAEAVLRPVWAGHGIPPAEAVEILNGLLYPVANSQSLVLSDAEGLVVYSRAPAPPGFHIRNKLLFEAARDGQRDFVGPMFMGEITGQAVMTVSRRLADGEGRFIGVLVLGLRPDILIRPVLDGLDLGQDGMVSILRHSDRFFVARHPLPSLSSAGELLRLEKVRPWPGGQGVDVATSPIDGIERVMSYRKSASGLVTVVGLSCAEIRKDWVLRQLRVLGAALPLIVLMLWQGGSLLRYMRSQNVAGMAMAKALSEREMLLAEVHHRVKNNLQIIQSLLTMESLCASEEARSGYQDSLQRIQAMGMIHELLYSTGQYAGIQVRDYVERLCTLLVGNHDSVTLSVEGDDVQLDLDRAVPFAMAMNEIVSNTLKHGFSDGRQGSIVVRLKHTDGTLTVSVADDGVGLPPGFDPLVGGNMGTRLLSGLAKQLGGTVAFESSVGTVVRLSFPLV